MNKYTTAETLHNTKLVGSGLSEPARDFIRASITSGSWKKHSCAMNCFKQYETSATGTINWPLSGNDVCGFAAWALSTKGLKPSSVRSYLSSLATVHELKGYSNHQCFNPIVKRVLKGAENLSFYKSMSDKSRKVMTLPLLKLLGHEISRTDWSANSKQVFWSACVTAFFGSFRFGELLAPSEWSYNKNETLLWSDIVFSDNSVLIHVKISKNRSPQGEYIDLFPFVGHNCCPVRSLLLLREMCSESLADIHDKPVFAFATGKLLTSKKLNETLEVLLRPYLGDQAAMIKGHSFRAAIPAAMAENPNMASEDDLKSWGRWNSNSFRLYTRLKLNKKRNIFNKITSILNV
jgi:hypothetical protein